MFELQQHDIEVNIRLLLDELIFNGEIIIHFLEIIVQVLQIRR